MPGRRILSVALLTTLSGWGMVASAQQLDVRFSCTTALGSNDERVVLADHGEFRLHGSRIDAFRWESALFRTTHGFDCSIDEADGVVAEIREHAAGLGWRVSLTDPRTARSKRGYTFERPMNCTIRLDQEGDILNIRPTCPALCGSRGNFTELSVNLKTGECRYEE